MYIITTFLFIMIGYFLLLIIDIVFSKKDMRHSWKGTLAICFLPTILGIIGFAIGYIEVLGSITQADLMEQEPLRVRGLRISLYTLYYGLIVAFTFLASQIIVYIKSKRKKNVNDLVPLSMRILAINVDLFLLMDLIFFIMLIPLVIDFIDISIRRSLIEEMKNAIGWLNDRPFVTLLVSLMIPGSVILYESIFHRFRGATIGQGLYEIRIIKNNQQLENLNFLKAIIRSIAKYFLGGLCFFIVYFNKKGRGIHDYLADSVVVYK